MRVDYERITELDVYDYERDTAYERCAACDDVREMADMALGNREDGYVCHGCARDEDRERSFIGRRFL